MLTSCYAFIQTVLPPPKYFPSSQTSHFHAHTRARTCTHARTHAHAPTSTCVHVGFRLGMRLCSPTSRQRCYSKAVTCLPDSGIHVPCLASAVSFERRIFGIDKTGITHYASKYTLYSQKDMVTYLYVCIHMLHVHISVHMYTCTYTCTYIHVWHTLYQTYRLG